MKGSVRLDPAGVPEGPLVLGQRDFRGGDEDLIGGLAQAPGLRPDGPERPAQPGCPGVDAEGVGQVFAAKSVRPEACPRALAARLGGESRREGGRHQDDRQGEREVASLSGVHAIGPHRGPRKVGVQLGGESLPSDGRSSPTPARAGSRPGGPRRPGAPRCRRERPDVVAVAHDHRGRDEDQEADRVEGVRRTLEPFHSPRMRPQTVPKAMMLAMWSVQLENSNRPISVFPIP